MPKATTEKQQQPAEDKGHMIRISRRAHVLLLKMQAERVAASGKKPTPAQLLDELLVKEVR
jgi:hypothetical protein